MGVSGSGSGSGSGSVSGSGSEREGEIINCTCIYKQLVQSYRNAGK